MAIALPGVSTVEASAGFVGSDRMSAVDAEEAYLCGQRAVELAAEGKSGLMVSIEREDSAHYRSRMGTAKLEDVAVRAEPMPDEFLDDTGMFVSDAFIDYLRPLVGPLPEMARLEYAKVSA